jgi:hypothetical protein
METQVEVAEATPEEGWRTSATHRHATRRYPRVWPSLAMDAHVVDPSAIHGTAKLGYGCAGTVHAISYSLDATGEATLSYRCHS